MLRYLAYAASLLLTLLSALLAVRHPDAAEIALEAALFISIYLLAHALKGEKAMARSMEDTISALRVGEKQLADANRRMRECGAELLPRYLRKAYFLCRNV
jgi:hypothetical protein